MYDLTGHLSDDNSQGPLQINPLNLVKNGVYDGWVDLELRVLAEDILLKRKGPTLHSPLFMKGRLLPHQLGACAKVLEACSWGGRGALLADEVGLGKTIEAGLIISELSCRSEASKVLILTPASLTTQWRDELSQTFGLNFVLADAESRRDAHRNGHSIWDGSFLIASIDTAKQPANMERIHAQQWDIVVVDEAHKLKDRKTHNFILVNGLKTKLLLLLTATPMQNRLQELFNQVCLIDPHLLGTRDSFRSKFYGDIRGIKAREPEELKKRLSHVMIRNRRQDHPELELVSRFGQTVPFALTTEELRLYEEVTEYIRAGYLDALQHKHTAKGYLMALYQRMLTSSSKAIAGSLRRRMERINDLLAKGPRLGETALQEDLASMVDLDYSDDASRAADRTIIDGRRGLDPQMVDILKAELKELKRLVALAEAIKMDTKALQLQNLMRSIPDDKVLVFTEFRATQRNLVELLQKDGFTVATFHGGMSREDKDAAVRAFTGPCRVMVSTESGGEGRNLQFCHILVNYDLPWNPMRVEQRIGRLHRIGQAHDVRIINFSTLGTIEEHVLELLSQKIKLFEEVVGALDIILGEVSSEGSLEEIIMGILAGSKDEIGKRFQEVGDKIENARVRTDEEGHEGARKVLSGPSMSTMLDPKEVLEGAMKEQAQVRDLVEAYLRRNGARVWRDGTWGLEGTAPRALIAALGLLPEFKLNFDRPSEDKTLTPMWVGHGAPILESILGECHKRGFTALRKIEGLKDRPKGVATFHLRLTLRGFRESQYLRTVHVDLQTLEEIQDPFGQKQAGTDVAKPPPEKQFASRIEAALSTARRAVEAQARRLCSELADENSRLCDAASERCNTYYKDLDDELRSKEKLLEDVKFDLLTKIRGAHDNITKARYNEELKKVNKRIEFLKAKDAELFDKYRKERIDELKTIESRRNLKPLLDLLAVGISVPAGTF